MIAIVNGPPGVGKTTTCRALARRVPGTIHVQGDHVRAFAPADARDHLGPGSTYRMLAVMAAEYLRMGAPRVLVDYCFRAPGHLAQFVDGCPAEVRVLTLWAPLEVVQARERARPGREPLGDAVEECWRAMAGHELGVRIDATADPEAVVGELDRRLR